MKLYGAIDLHSNNSVMALITEQLAAYRETLEDIVVESTYNWYWLVDGLMDAGHKLHRANTAAIQQYEGLKYTDDPSDARWLGHLLRLGILSQGHIYPKQHRLIGWYAHAVSHHWVGPRTG